MRKKALNRDRSSKGFVKTLPPLITIKQAMEFNIGSERTIRRMCQSGDLQAVKISGEWRLPRDSFLKSIGLKN